MSLETKSEFESFIEFLENMKQDIETLKQEVNAIKNKDTASELSKLIADKIEAKGGYY